MSDLLAELEWRGLIAQSTDRVALAAALEAGPITYYCGFDPTAASLHHGHLVQLLLLRHLQLAGHNPVALGGGATGQIGDPRQSGERVLNDKETVAAWTEKLREQVSRFLSFEGANAARVVNNLDWTAELSAIDLLRDVGKHFRLGTMLAKDTVARRLASDEGISFTEFSYQLLQGNDFLELFRRHGVTLQTGGNDQWGNLLSGVELIRKSEGAAVHVMTTPLITKSDGTKFGKTEGGAVWLDPQMMSPYAFYQFWLNTEDADVVNYLKVFTFLGREEIAELETAVAERPGARAAQRRLAAEVTALVHGADAVAQAVAASAALFGRGSLSELSAETVEAAVAGLPQAKLAVGTDLVTALAETGLVASRGAARRTFAEGGVYLNNENISDVDRVLVAEDFLHGRWALLRRGKKTIAAVELTN